MIWLIGAGPMAQDYAKVLQAQGQNFRCITRSKASADIFASTFDVEVDVGGLDSFLATQLTVADHAIVATGVENLAQTTSSLVEFGVKSILVEKPAGLNIEQVRSVIELMHKHQAQIYVGYNRRFFETVQKAQQLIAEDGGVLSLNYEITELAHVIEPLNIDQSVKKHWFLANTSHVVDLAFYLGGRPKQLACFTADHLNWHPASACFSGAGMTEHDALFSYHGNWKAPGRWSLEILTNQRRFIFRPMEQLQIQLQGSVDIEQEKIDFHYDKKFKPGLFKQVEAFLLGDGTMLCPIHEHFLNMSFYYQMAGYKTVESGNIR